MDYILARQQLIGMINESVERYQKAIEYVRLRKELLDIEKFVVEDDTVFVKKLPIKRSVYLSILLNRLAMTDDDIVPLLPIVEPEPEALE